MSDSTERYQLPEQLKMAAGAVRDYVRNEIVPLEQQIPTTPYISPKTNMTGWSLLLRTWECGAPACPRSSEAEGSPYSPR